MGHVAPTLPHIADSMCAPALLQGVSVQAVRLSLVQAEGLPELLRAGAGVRRQGLARDLVHVCSEAAGFSKCWLRFAANLARHRI